MLDSLTASCGMSVSTTAGGAALGADGAAAALGVLPAAPSTSALTIRPPGPEPVSEARSMPCASASRRASGLAFTLSPPDFAAGCAGAGAGGGGAGAGVSLAGWPAPVSPPSLATGSLAGGGAALAEEASSPSPAIIAITVPTFTPSEPSGTSICAIVPSSTASNSIVALSVSISARISPDLTLSPSFTSHLASVPSSMVGDKAGILSSIGIETGFLLRRAGASKQQRRPYGQAYSGARLRE